MQNQSGKNLRPKKRPGIRSQSILFFWIIITLYLTLHGMAKYFTILTVWDYARFSDFVATFSYNIMIAAVLGAICSAILYQMLARPEKLIAVLREEEHKEEQGGKNAELLCSLLYARQKRLAYVLLGYSLIYSVGTVINWLSPEIYVGTPSTWISYLNGFLLNLVMGLLAFHLYKFRIVRLTEHVLREHKIYLMKDKKPINMDYELFIIGMLMILMCIFLMIYSDTLMNIYGEIVTDRLLLISNTLNDANVPLNNVLATNILEREISRESIRLIGMDPFINIDDITVLRLFRGSVSANFYFLAISVIIVIVAMIYLARIVHLTERLIKELSGYLHRILEKVSSLKHLIPLTRFDFLGYMIGYINLLIRHIHKVMSNIDHSVTLLSNSLENSMNDTAKGTNIVYKITHNFAWIHLKTNLQFQSERNMCEDFEDYFETLKAIDNEISLQEQQLEAANNRVDTVKVVITEIEQSSQNVARIFEQLNQSASGGLNLVENIYGVITEISKTSYNIQDIVSSIEKISRQTGLLAMSASIESAHAGAHGQGFSVVAQSVRNLAEDSATQSKAIRDQVEETIDRVETGVLLARNVNRSFQQIVASTQNSAALFHQIYHSIEAQQQQSTKIRTEIGELLSTVKDILGSTQLQMKTLEGLTVSNLELEDLVSAIRDASQRQAEINEEIISLFENLKNQVLSDVESIFSITRKINRLKLD